MNKTIVKTPKSDVYPLINEIVDELSNTDLKAVIERSCETRMDKSIFMMFVTMYFYAFLSEGLSKQDIKLILTDAIRDPEKRQYCLQVFFGKMNQLLEDTKQKLIGL
jgi:Mg2+/citrate symporter